MLSQHLLLSSPLSLHIVLLLARQCPALSPLDGWNSRHCLLSARVFIPPFPPFLHSLLSIHPSKHNQHSLSLTAPPTLSLSKALPSASLSFSLHISDSRSFKFMLMIFPNLISESRAWGRLCWALKVIGLQVSHTVALLWEIQRTKHPTNIAACLWIVYLSSAHTHTHTHLAVSSCCSSEKDGGRKCLRR